MFAEFASLTLGSGAAAAVLCRLDEHPEAHRLVGGVARAASEHHELCVGDLDRMTTDTHGLLVAGLDLGEAAWKHAGHVFDWELGMDWYIIHQVSPVHTKLMTERLGIDPDKVPLTFPHYGNVGPAAIPITLASVADRIRPAIGCCAWASGRGSTRASPKSSGEPGRGAHVCAGVVAASARRRHVGTLGHRSHAGRARSTWPSHDGGTHRWHVLDTAPTSPPASPDRPTILCVHGNPTWSYAWATFLRGLHEQYRVVAVDQLGMGYSERTAPRRYVDRVRDLDDVIVALRLPAARRS